MSKIEDANSRTQDPPVLGIGLAGRMEELPAPTRPPASTPPPSLGRSEFPTLSKEFIKNFKEALSKLGINSTEEINSLLELVSGECSRRVYASIDLVTGD
ncbi:hypothetical protein HZA38_06515 [Candidatus Peregrinibacteria bacterium]|nr:hypothetical protein [Candidatus Peregrinibacteria bacterium]